MKKMTFRDINWTYVEWSQDIRPLQQQSKWEDLKWNLYFVVFRIFSFIFSVINWFQKNSRRYEIQYMYLYGFSWPIWQRNKIRSKNFSVLQLMISLYLAEFLLVDKSCATENGSNSLWALALTLINVSFWSDIILLIW